MRRRRAWGARVGITCSRIGPQRFWDEDEFAPAALAVSKPRIDASQQRKPSPANFSGT